MQDCFLHNKPKEMDMTNLMLKSGIGISLWSCNFNDCFCHNASVEKPQFSIGYVLEGNADCSINNKEMSFKQNSSHMQFMKDINSKTYYQKNEKFEYLSLWIKPDLFEKYLLDVGSKKCYKFENFLENQQYAVQHSELVTNEKKVLFELSKQLKQYNHTRNALLIESRCLDLISFNLQKLLGKELNGYRPASLNEYTCQQLAIARDILLSNLENPPSLLELSYTIGINDCTLKKGFKALYGNTVYGFIRDQRLEKAYKLLVVNNYSVTQSAHVVGYNNLSHFARSFKEKFGVSPGTLVSH
ncbi:MAG: AraC family transcriptional regulator [Lachnospiraceae bacterium]|nr:AraC family transcriptional regulator [Lachnospiraceae bacterium]